MADKSIVCYRIPSAPLPLMLPIECVAAVVEKPVLEALSEAPTDWMQGHLTWNNQRLPVLSYASLHGAKEKPQKKAKQTVVVLNPIPQAARKAYSALICQGVPEQVNVKADSTYAEIPGEIDKRYVEAILEQDGNKYIIPKLAALEVAFSYF